MRQRIDIDQIKSGVADILSLLNDVGHLSALMSINAQQYNLTVRLTKALSHAESVEQHEYSIEPELAPERIYKDFNDILGNWSEPPTDQQKSKLGEVVKRTLRITNFINSLPSVRESLPPLQQKTIVTELERLREARESVLKQIEAEKRKGENKDNNRLAELNSSLTTLNIRIESLQKDKIRVAEASKVEQDMDARIKSAFDELSLYTTVLEKERATLVREYNFVCAGIIITAVFFVVWLSNFYGLVLGNKLLLPYWYSILPYYLPVPVFVAIFWVLIFQKNRASRLSNNLSERLFEIHYLEGLLLTSNKLLLDTNQSVEKFNLILDSIVNSYLGKMDSEKIDDAISDDVPFKAADAESILKSLNELIQIVKK